MQRIATDLQTILAAIPDGVALLDAELRYVYVDDRLAALCGEMDKMHAGETVQEISPQFAAALEPLCRAALREGTSQSMTRVDSLGPAERHLRIEAHPRHEAGGRAIGVCLIVRDITQQEQNEARYCLLAETAGVIPWEADGESFQFTYVGPQAKTILGYDVEEWYSTGFWELHIHPDDRDRAVQFCIEHSQSEGHYSFEYRMLARDGRPVWLHDAVQVVCNARGNRLLRGFLIDTTTLRAAEEARRLSEERLRRAEEKLRRREAELAHVSRVSTTSEMATGLAHELSQPLHSISNYARALLRFARDGHSAESLDELVEKIVVEADRAGEVLRRMRQFVRKREPQRLVVDLTALVLETLDLVGFEARQRQVTVTFEASQAALHSLVDPIQIEQVLVNLLRNAFDAVAVHAPADRRVQVRVFKSGAGEIGIQVADSGPGILPEDRSRVFNPFFTRKPGGLGMGLAISHSIVEAHEGRLQLLQGAGGATFLIVLPAHAEQGAR